MTPQQNVSLRDFSTMRLGGDAAYLVEITERQQLPEAVAWAESQNLPIIMIGDGSNIVWRDEGFPGLVIVNKLLKYEDFAVDEANHHITIGGGENWDNVVARTVESGLTGIEALSLVPGTAGATPVQNVGAYGQEIADTLQSLEAYDTQTHEFVNIQKQDCGFGYRSSRFKGVDKGRYFITTITLHLVQGSPQPPFYASLQKYLDEHEIHDATPLLIRDAVINIRQGKLPDPATVANNGSFFANPIIEPDLLAQIQTTFPDIPHWDTEDGKAKIPAAWLLEQAGFKDIHDADTGMATWYAQPLVLVNEHATSTAQLLEFRQKIIDTVQDKFGITLQQEPELLP